MFVVDPQGIDEEKDSELAATRFGYCSIYFFLNDHTVQYEVGSLNT